MRRAATIGSSVPLASLGVGDRFYISASDDEGASRAGRKTDVHGKRRIGVRRTAPLDTRPPGAEERSRPDAVVVARNCTSALAPCGVQRSQSPHSKIRQTQTRMQRPSTLQKFFLP